MTARAAGVLHGRTVVVTRPQDQAGALAALIERAGGHALIFPAIAIAPVEDTRKLDELIARLAEFHWAIFVSPNAVEHALERIVATHGLPSSLRYAAVGRGTVRALARFGIKEVLAPERFDSETLLELAPLQSVRGQRVVIFRGVGGRELIASTLAARGAQVEYAECYRREVPRLDPAPLLDQWRQGGIDAITFTSSEGLHNFAAMIGSEGVQLLRQTPVFAPHPRIAQAARELGAATVVETSQGDDGVCAGLVQWFSANA